MLPYVSIISAETVNFEVNVKVEPHNGFGITYLYIQNTRNAVFLANSTLTGYNRFTELS